MNVQRERHGGRARTVRRSILAFAGFALVATLLLAVLPTHGEVIEGGEVIAGEVNCGTAFANTRWSDADDCDGPILVRFAATVIALGVTVMSGGVGLALLSVQARRER
ncbi:MAG: hypothetical protein QOI20_3420 [Acidimicrobiaceae bacterium]|nr:hypothetical protein [Acidimicrobiaceae bacterium]